MNKLKIITGINWQHILIALAIGFLIVFVSDLIWDFEGVVNAFKRGFYDSWNG
ncbi:MAG: hypothetical protein Q4A64_03230 [Porphyromonadaceae bacterium]|nr:hypothetical protein [Porphyromonadaceae bacterium]